MSSLTESYARNSPLGGHFIRQNRREKDARRAAEDAEAARLENIANATRSVNEAFDAPERQRQYSSFLNALRDRFQQDLGRQRQVTQRNQKFALARSGLTGGSAAVDARRALGEDFSRGLLQAEDRAQSALGQLKSGDEAARLNLIQLAQQGLDATTVSQRAQSAARASTEGALGDAATRGLGDVFGASADVYRRQNEAAARRQAQFAPVGSLYGGSR